MAALSISVSPAVPIVVSHVNDAGFWLFGKFTGATEAQTELDDDGNYPRHGGDCQDNCFQLLSWSCLLPVALYCLPVQV